MKTAQDSYTITIKQIVRLQERMHFEKIQLIQVQNGRQLAIIHIHMANIMKTAQDIYTITIKQIVRLQERMHFEKIQLIQVQNGRQLAIIHIHMAVIW